jgi:hypothetical protein
MIRAWLLLLVRITRRSVTGTAAVDPPKIVRVNWRSMLLFKLDDEDFEGIGTYVDVGVHGAGRHGGGPVGVVLLPLVDVVRAGGFDNVHGAVGEGYEDARVIVMVHGERLMREYGGAPDSDVVILKLVFAVSLRWSGREQPSKERVRTQRRLGHG